MNRLLRTPQLAGNVPASVVVYLDPKQYREDPGRLDIQGCMDTTLHSTYRVVRMWEVNPGPILEKDAPGLWPFVPLMCGNPEVLVVKSKERIVGAPESLASTESKKELLAVMTGLASRVIEDRRVLDRLIAEITDMGENYVFDRLMDMGRQQATRTARRQEVLRVLRRRFGEVGEPVARHIGEIDDLEQLGDLVEEAFDASSLEAFVALLPAPRE